MVSYNQASSGIVLDRVFANNSTGDAAGDVFLNVERFVLSQNDDRYLGNASAEFVSGNLGNDELLGGAGADILQGDEGNDRLEGGAGGDAIEGGDGFDTSAYSASATAIILDRVTSSNNTGDAAGDSFTSIERFDLSAFNDRFVGNSESEFVFGGAGNDTILAGAGDDWLIGQSGGDSLDGGAGFDSATYTDANGAVTVDRLVAANGAGDAAGNSWISIERFYLSGFNDRFVGSADSEFIYSSIGNDTILAGAGDDWLLGEAGADSLDGGSGFDNVGYSTSTSAVTVDRVNGANNAGDAAGDAFAGIERFFLTDFADRYVGDASADNVSGGFGADTLIGAAGNDVLIGDGGDDSLTGGTGNDAFVFAPGFGRDVITDFAGGVGVGDVIEFSGLGPAFDTFAELMAVATQSGANTVISIDANNTLTLQNVARTALVADDFWFT